MSTLDIGIASYKSADKLQRTIESIAANTVQPYRLIVWHNDGGGGEDDEQARKIVRNLPAPHLWQDSPNVGYAGAVNGMLARSTAPYFLYCDNDIEVRTRGWDQMMMEVLQQNPECAQVFPGAGHYGFHNGRYHECLWNAGYCWMANTSSLNRIEFCDPVGDEGEDWDAVMDMALGHHEEVDLMIRLRLAGFTIGCRPDVDVFHHETATQSDDALHKPGGRIHDGVVRWMNKWNRYFCGDVLKYSMDGYDPRALRYTDWTPDALYMERLTLHYFPDWNKNPRVVHVPGVGDMDVIEILKPKGCYRGRAI